MTRNVAQNITARVEAQPLFSDLQKNVNKPAGLVTTNECHKRTRNSVDLEQTGMVSASRSPGRV